MKTDYDSVFFAIADPTRRAIVGMLSGTMDGAPIGQVADRFPISRQAVTKHIKVLEESGLLRLEKRGRERWCRPDLARLEVVYQWVAVYQRFWTEKLSALGQYLDDNP